MPALLCIVLKLGVSQHVKFVEGVTKLNISLSFFYGIIYLILGLHNLSLSTSGPNLHLALKLSM